LFFSHSPFLNRPSFRVGAWFPWPRSRSLFLPCRQSLLLLLPCHQTQRLSAEASSLARQTKRLTLLFSGAIRRSFFKKRKGSERVPNPQGWRERRGSPLLLFVGPGGSLVIVKVGAALFVPWGKIRTVRGSLSFFFSVPGFFPPSPFPEKSWSLLFFFCLGRDRRFFRSIFFSFADGLFPFFRSQTSSFWSIPSPPRSPRNGRVSYASLPVGPLHRGSSPLLLKGQQLLVPPAFQDLPLPFLFFSAAPNNPFTPMSWVASLDPLPRRGARPFGRFPPTRRGAFPPPFEGTGLFVSFFLLASLGGYFCFLFKTK